MLWRRWRDENDASAREALILLHLEFAKMLAAKCFAGRYGDELEFADYMQFATVGLLESIDRYDPASQASFRTFSAPRINGAMLDGVARLSEQQRQISARQRMLAERAESLTGSMESKEGTDEIFEQLAGVAIGLALGYMLEGSSMYQVQEPVSMNSAYTNVEVRQLQQQVRSLVDMLPERERSVIKYHYLNHLRFEAIAEILSLSKGRVSQLHKNALDLLRKEAGKISSCNIAW